MHDDRNLDVCVRETPMLAAGSLTRSNCSLLVEQ